MSKDLKVLDLNQWIDSFSAFMAEETLKILRANSEKRGPEVGRALCIHFLSRVLANTVLDTLNTRKESAKTEEEQYNYSKKLFLDLKLQVQDAVALSFQTALGHFTGRQVEYYCQIKPIPEPLNKTVN
jgi:hypothetical protein